MAKPSIADITITQTFQNWFDKTNELTGIIRSEAMTASATGDSTTGNATLVGNFTATNLIGDIQSDDISSATNGGSVTFGSPTIHNALADAICSTFTFGAGGGRTRYTDGNISWDIGMENSTNANFLIDTGTGDPKFLLSPSGTLTVPDYAGNNAVIENDVTCDDLFANNINYSGSFSGPGGSLDFDSDIYVSGDGYFEGDVVTAYTASDRRLKENIEIIDHAIDKIEQINGYTFNYIAKPEERVAGVIAQEVEKVLPGVTFELDDKGHKAVRYDNIIPLLIQAIKELNDKVEALEKSKD